MSWPQYFILGWFLVGLLGSCREKCRDRSLSSIAVTIHCLVYAMATAIIFVVLHCGGFW